MCCLFLRKQKAVKERAGHGKGELKPVGTRPDVTCQSTQSRLVSCVVWAGNGLRFEIVKYFSVALIIFIY